MMSRFNYGLANHASTTKPANGFNPSLKNERHDEHASQSGSEDGSYALYGDTHKIEADLEEESNTALTSQTLNADGTPKRPMNAFMIFARRRRPQVSAENQAMRTGEISKILSKEWVSMPPTEKQFYLEQAKQLKETFNSKYPDYVYRRRPNNSRKRRRSDGSTMRPADHLLADHTDDLVGSVDLDASPTDLDDHLDTTVVSPYSRSSHDVSQSFGDHSKYGMSQSRSSGHHFASEHPYRSNGHHDSRMSYGSSSSSDRIPHTHPLTASPRLSVGQGGMNYPYVQSQNHANSPTVFGTDHVGPHQGWQSRVERVQPTWLPSGSQERAYGGPKQSSYSPSTPSSAWSNPHDSPTTPANSSSPSPNFFPTLTTPFYPSQHHAPTFQSNAAAPASHLSTSPAQYDHLHQANAMSREFAARGYSASTPIPTGNSYSPQSGRGHVSYPQRNLPPVQTISGYSHSQPSSSSSSGQENPPQIWSRE
ncbi:hypothetical protein B0H34DRAFT_542337 [Crassisporium funariophilum]|nr:hypothetical protein B0H34DRAFT_542337 [Crassisporium funariophilum]